MLEFALISLLFVILAALSAWSAGGFIAWARREWKLMVTDNWAPKPEAGTMRDPRCLDMVARQRAKARELEEKGFHSLPRGRGYRAAVTHLAPEKPVARSGHVIQLTKSLTRH